MRTRFFIIIYLFLISVSSCITRPDYVLDESKMVDVLVEVHRSEGLIELQQNVTSTNTEEYKQHIMAAVLVKQGVTRAQYDSSLVWYGENLEDLVRVYGKVQKKISEEIDYWTNVDHLSRNEFSVSEAGDSVQLWTIENFQIFDESRLASFRFWEIKSDSNYLAGDSLVWHMHVPHVPEAHYLVASFSLNYNDQEENSLPISHTVVMRRDTTIDISCVGDSTKVFDSMLATLMVLKDSIAVPDTYAFIDSLSLIRIHKTHE